jgi:hypothetical protein
VGLPCFASPESTFGLGDRSQVSSQSVDKYRKTELLDTSIQPGDKIETLLDGKEVLELGADVPAEVSGENGVVEINGGHIVELPSGHNESAELDVINQEHRPPVPLDDR